MTSKDKILEIYRSDWREAIADAAYMIVASSEVSGFIDKYETLRDKHRYVELITTLDSFDATKPWKEYVFTLAGRASDSYIKERATGNNLSFGGPMTFIGHASHTFIDWGFLGYLANSLDNGVTEELFNKYVLVDTKFHDAVHSGDNETAIKLADEWRLSMAEVDDAYEKLCTLLGIATE